MKIEPICRPMIYTGLVMVLVATMYFGRAEASWLSGLWFEVGGSYSSLDPQMDEHLKATGFEFPVASIEGAFGVEAALHQEIGRVADVFLRCAYARSSRDYSYTHPIHLPPGTFLARTQQLTIIPITLGVLFRTQMNSLAMVFELGGMIRVVEFATRYDPNDMEIKKEEQSWGAQGSLGLEWTFVQKLVCGVRAGYRFAEKVKFYGFSVPGDGYFFGVYMGFRPSAPPN